MMNICDTIDVMNIDIDIDEFFRKVSHLDM